MIVIGITGPTGSGKTTVLNELEKMGAVAIDCDAVYHRLLKNNAELREELLKLFGDCILGSDGEIDRKAMGAVVFHNAERLEELNDIANRYVVSAVKGTIEMARITGEKMVAVDGITLLESGLGRLCNLKVAVLASKEQQIRRICARDGIDEAYACARLESQKSDFFYMGNCDITLFNDYETMEEFAVYVRNKLEEFLRFKKDFGYVEEE